MFRRRRPAAVEPAATGEPAAAEHDSPALANLLGSLGSATRAQILDLGPASGDNVTFLSRFPCRLWVADLPAALRGSPLPAGDSSRLLAALPEAPAESFDVVFAWDLLDYLERGALAALGERLASLCRPQARLFALVSYLGEIPEEPLRFTLREGGRLLYRPASERRRPGPRLTTGELGRLFSAFEVASSFLLRNGRQEYLLARRTRPNDAGTSPPAAA